MSRGGTTGGSPRCRGCCCSPQPHGEGVEPLFAPQPHELRVPEHSAASPGTADLRPLGLLLLCLGPPGENFPSQRPDPSGSASKGAIGSGSGDWGRCEGRCHAAAGVGLGEPCPAVGAPGAAPAPFVAVSLPSTTKPQQLPEAALAQTPLVGEGRAGAAPWARGCGEGSAAGATAGQGAGLSRPRVDD